MEEKMKLLLENWHKYLNETGFGEGTPAPGKWSEKKTYITEEPEVEEYSDEKEYEELGSTEERYSGSDRDKMIYAIHFFKELEQRYPGAEPEDAETIVDDLVGDPGTHRDAMINLVTKVLTPGATLTGKAVKPVAEAGTDELGDILDDIRMRKTNIAHVKSIPPSERTTAGTQNLGNEPDPTLRTIHPGDPASFKPAKVHKK
jgi:hypothetical protein